MKTLTFIVALVMLIPALVGAQTAPLNPTKAEFTASIDHATVGLVYEIGWFLGAATAPVSMVDLGKPTPDTVTGCSAPVPCIQSAINVMPLGFSEYTAKVRARVGTLYSEWSPASNPFTRVPGSPSGPIVKK